MRFIKIISTVLVTMFLIGSSVFAVTLDEAYGTIKSNHPEFIERMYKGGANDEDILNFISSAIDYMVQKNIEITEENFDEVMMETMETVIYYSSNLQVYGALTKEFTDEAMYLIINKEIPENLRPLYNAVKEIVLSSPELFGKGTGGRNNKGGTTGGSTGSTPGNTPDNNKDDTQEDVITFNDLTNVPWATKAISHLVKLDVLKGYDDGSFRPSQNITRAELAKVVVTAFGLYNPDDKAKFVDVTEDKWYFSYIGSAQKNGIINGYEDGSFKPDALITREDIAVIVYRTSLLKNISFDSIAQAEQFTDDAAISNYAKEAVKAMQRAGIINGMGDGTFAPKAYATRAQAAKIIHMSIV